MMDISFRLSHFNNKFATVPRVVIHTWQEFNVKIIASPVVRRSKDGELYSPALFVPAERKNENVKEISLLSMDYDHDADIDADFNVWQQLGISSNLYTSHSHKRKTEFNPNAEPRFRINVLLAEPIPAEFHLSLFQWAARHSGGKIDAQTKDASRMYYMPAKYSADSPYDYRVFNGQPLSWRLLGLQKESEIEPQKPIEVKEKPPKAAPDKRFVVKGNLEDLQEKYRGRAIDAVTKTIEGSAPGTRHVCRRNAARLLGGYVGGGFFTEAEARQILSDLVAQHTNDFTAAMKTVEDGLRDGQSEPITLEAEEKRRAAFLKALTPSEDSQREGVCKSSGAFSEKEAAAFDDVILLTTNHLGWSEEDKITLLALYSVFGGRSIARVSATSLADRITQREGCTDRDISTHNQFGRRRLTNLRKTLKQTVNYPVLKLIQQGGAKAGINKRTGKPFPSKWQLDMRPFLDAKARSEQFLKEWNLGEPRFSEWRDESGMSKKPNPGRAREKAASIVAAEYDKREKPDDAETVEAPKKIIDDFTDWIAGERQAKKAAIRIANALENLGKTRLEKVNYVASLFQELRAILVQDDAKNRRRKLKEIQLLNRGSSERLPITHDSMLFQPKEKPAPVALTEKDNAYMNSLSVDELFDLATADVEVMGG